MAPLHPPLLPISWCRRGEGDKKIYIYMMCLWNKKPNKNPWAAPSYSSAARWLGGHVPLYLDRQDTSVEGTGWLQARGGQVWIFQQEHGNMEHLDTWMEFSVGWINRGQGGVFMSGVKVCVRCYKYYICPHPSPTYFNLRVKQMRHCCNGFII